MSADKGYGCPIGENFGDVSAGSATSITVTGLSADADYIKRYFQVVAFDAKGTQSPASNEVVAILQVILTAPKVKATSGDAQVTIGWDAVPGASNYSVCAASTDLKDVTDIASCPAYGGQWIPDTDKLAMTVSSLPDGTKLVNNTTYYFCVFAKDANGNVSSASNQATATPTAATTPTTGKLNDTGITTCSDGTTNGLPCPVAGFPGQDAESGRDVTANDNTDGHAGFSFTKLDANGAPLANQAADYATTPWACVKDNVTGLTWEVKTNDSGLHHQNWSYTWYEPDSTKNGGTAGTQNGGSCGGTSQCDTSSYVQAVNAAGWCGAKDWRMPMVDELSGIASLDRANPAIDTAYFPNTPSSWYWSSSSVAGNGYGAWYVAADYGYGNWYLKNYRNQVRLVRGGQ